MHTAASSLTAAVAASALEGARDKRVRGRGTVSWRAFWQSFKNLNVPNLQPGNSLLRNHLTEVLAQVLTGIGTKCPLPF